MGPNEIIRSILSAIPIPPSSHAPWVPESVDAAFRQALAKDPNDRPPHVLPWARDLAAILGRLEVNSPGWFWAFQDLTSAKETGSASPTFRLQGRKAEDELSGSVFDPSASRTGAAQPTLHGVPGAAAD